MPRFLSLYRLFVLLMLALVACAPAALTPAPATTSAPAEPATTSAPASTAAPKPAETMAATAAAKPSGPAVTFDYNQPSENPAYTASYVAMDNNFFVEHGVQPSGYSVSRSSAATVTALTAGEGSAVLAPAAPDAFILAIDKGSPLKIVAAYTYLPPYVLIAQQQYNSVEDLRGKTCIQSNVSSGEAPFLKAIMSAHGLEYPADYTILAGGEMSARLAAMEAGQVDCTVITPPQSYQLMDKGMKQIARASDVIKDYHFIVLGVNTEYAEKNREVIVNALKAMAQGQEFAFDQKNWDSAAESLVKHKASPEQYAKRTITDYYTPENHVQVPNIKISIAALDGVAVQMKELGTLPQDQTLDWKKYVDPSYWEEATGQTFDWQ